jgi:ABC-type lipoprotein release transport system permease subunit
VLFEVKPADPVTFVATACVLGAIGLGAAFLPARCAASLDPMRALRHA